MRPWFPIGRSRTEADYAQGIRTGTLTTTEATTNADSALHNHLIAYLRSEVMSPPSVAETVQVGSYCII